MALPNIRVLGSVLVQVAVDYPFDCQFLNIEIKARSVRWKLLTLISRP